MSADARVRDRHRRAETAFAGSGSGRAASRARPAVARPRARPDRPAPGITLVADKAYDTENFVNELRSMNVRAHVAENTS